MFIPKKSLVLSGIALSFFMAYMPWRGSQLRYPLPQWLGYTLMALFFVFAVRSYKHRRGHLQMVNRKSF